MYKFAYGFLMDFGSWSYRCVLLKVGMYGGRVGTRHVSKTRPRYHFVSYMAIMYPLMALKGMVAAVVLDALSVLTLVL